MNRKEREFIWNIFTCWIEKETDHEVQVLHCGSWDTVVTVLYYCTSGLTTLLSIMSGDMEIKAARTTDSQMISYMKMGNSLQMTN